MSQSSRPAADSRSAAASLLGLVLRRRQPLDEAWAAALGNGGAVAGLSSRDRAFARLLATTVLRRLGQIDAAIAACLEKPLPRGAAIERDLIRLGAAQLLFLGTPAHAAVDGSMRQVPARSRWRALVNAVLRRLSRDGAAMLAAQDAARLNTPGWLWRSWSAAWGEDMARAIATAHQHEPPLDITLKNPEEAAAWAARLDAVMLPTGSLRRVAGGAVEGWDGFDEGAWWVQDAAAALPARLLAARPGQVVADLCAAPGGKAAQLAAAGARVFAVDRSANRLERVRANLGRLHLEAQTIAADAAEWRPPQPLDGVLLDAPCSATGTIRRHPDVAHLKQPGDVAKLTALQDRLLAAAAGMLAPGGVLVYCVCSLQPEEGEARIAALLAGGAPLEPEPVRPEEIGGMAASITPDGALRTLPSHLAEAGGMDGFYACRLRRR